MSDGHTYIDKSIELGAVAIVCEEFPENIKQGITYVKVENSRKALAVIASNFYDEPSSKIQIIGVTGTNGKTTTATLLFQLFKQLGYKCGLISTVKNQIHQEVLPSSFTTPDPVELHKLFATMVEKKCTYCFMEVSSHALDQYRVHGVQFKGAVFTNITHDHLDYHKTFNAYIHAKKMLFDMLPKDAFALVNKDDKHWNIFLQNCQAKQFTYATQHIAEYRAKMIENTLQGMHAYIDGVEIWLRITGKFNLYNALAVYAVADLLKIDKNDILMCLSKIEGAEGRFQVVRLKNNKTFVVDYAHTPDALQKIIENIKETLKPNQKIITVFGCGGDRDKLKRPEMGKIASQLSDQCIITSDNPRNENPKSIIQDILSGIEKQHQHEVMCVEDRAEAIKIAHKISSTHDIVLVAGKGHEKYQEILGIKHYFNDVEVIQQLSE